MESKMIVAIERVRSLPRIEGHNEATDADVLLVKEYLRRVALLARDVGDWRYGPFFDATKVANEPMDSETEKTLSEVITSRSQPNAYIRKLCADYIRWTAYAARGNTLVLSHLNVYEPLISLFERGQNLGIHHGDVMVGGYAIPLSNWHNMAEQAEFDISPKNLAAVDSHSHH